MSEGGVAIDQKQTQDLGVVEHRRGQHNNINLTKAEDMGKGRTAAGRASRRLKENSRGLTGLVHTKPIGLIVTFLCKAETPSELWE